MPTSSNIDMFWLLQDLDTGADHVFTSEHMAMHNAEQIVGNRAVAHVGGSECMMMYGPGDGSTRIMIRRFDRRTLLRMGYDLPID